MGLRLYCSATTVYQSACTSAGAYLGAYVCENLPGLLGKDENAGEASIAEVRDEDANEL